MVNWIEECPSQGLDRLGVFSCGDRSNGVGVVQVVDAARRPD